jgi:hypothetical protein
MVHPKLVLWQARSAVKMAFRYARVDLEDPKRINVPRNEVMGLARCQQVGALNTATGVVGVFGWYCFINAQRGEAVVFVRRVDLYRGGEGLVL